jgi:hypothetical protein
MSHPALILYHMAKADFLERVRRYSFLLTLAGSLWLAYGIISERLRIITGAGYRGVYNSAWIGMLMAICASTFLSLCGFYIVKNSVERDSVTRVGRILAATPMRKEMYTVAKTLSNFAVLGSMVLVLMAAALAMQWLRPEARPISLWQLWSPFIFICLPAMLLVGSVALLFETLPVLRGGVGNVTYFFVWTAGIAVGAIRGIDDPAGIHIFSDSTQHALEQLNLSNGKTTSFSITVGGSHASHTFLWNGVDWTPYLLAGRLAWVAAGLAVALLASVFFHRFDPARESVREKEVNRERGQEEANGLAADPGQISATQPQALLHDALTPLSSRGNTRFVRLMLSELALMLKGLRWWWYLVAAGLLVAEFTSPTTAAREGVLLAAWIWPVLLWSQMGCRESKFATQSLIFSADRVAYRQLLAVWTAGVLVALLTGSGTGFRLLLGANWQMLEAWVAAAVFIPSLALAFGVWSGSSKFFEALYTVWWYVGPLHQLPSLDFVGGTPVSSSPGLYLSLAAALLLAACVGRRRQVAYA